MSPNWFIGSTPSSIVRSDAPLARLKGPACAAIGRAETFRYWHKPAVGGWAEHVRSAQVFQTSTCSAIARASSTSIPRYLTVLSILVWPSRKLDGPEIASAPVDQGCLRAPERMRSE